MNSHIKEVPTESRYTDNGRLQPCQVPGCKSLETRLRRVLGDDSWMCRKCFLVRVAEYWEEQNANSDDELEE